MTGSRGHRSNGDWSLDTGLFARDEQKHEPTADSELTASVWGHRGHGLTPNRPATHQQCLRKTWKLRVDPSFIGCFCSPGQSEGQRGHLIWPSLHAARIQVKDAVYLADGNVSESGNHSLLILVRMLTLGVVIYNTNNQPEIIRFNNARCLKSLEVQESRPVMLCTDASGAVFIIFTPNSSTRPVLKVTSM